jgi:NAD(P)-dependent dehydrogenase (short-subunit alcohol dehydrogenase family)
MLKQKDPFPDRRGNIINISSILGLGASAPNYNVSYSTSKAALINMTRELAIQWAQRGVRINSIAPGYFPSEVCVYFLSTLPLHAVHFATCFLNYLHTCPCRSVCFI